MDSTPRVRPLTSKFRWSKVSSPRSEKGRECPAGIDQDDPHLDADMKSIRPRHHTSPVHSYKSNSPSSALRSFAALVSAFMLVGAIIFARPVSELTRSQATEKTRLIEPDIDAG